MGSIPMNVKPFVKWAGGKGQLIDEYRKYYPAELKTGKIKKYVEPFTGGGAIFFDIIKNYEVEEFIINDINFDLIITYEAIKRNVDDMIADLKKLQDKYSGTEPDQRQAFFYSIREEFNSELKHKDFSKYSKDYVDRAVKLLLLNRTCFNGLYRVNSKGEFNVPFGKYKNPRICDEDNLRAVSDVLNHKNVSIMCKPYEELESIIDQDTFVYFDPPYRPLSTTSSFTSYSKFDFNENEQVKLAEFYKKLNSQYYDETNQKRVKLMLSNSDPKNVNDEDNFFQDNYLLEEGKEIKNIKINKIKANRMINAKASGRGAISELLITNYEL